MMANWIAVAMPDSIAAEGVDGNTGTWRIWRSGIDDVPCFVEYRLDGATDFTLQTSEGYNLTLTSHTEDGVTYQTGMVYLPADESEVFLVLTPTNDARKEETETVTIQLTAYYSVNSYNIYPQTQTMTILDNDDWYVSVAATDASAAESSASNPNYGVYTITRSNETDTTHYLDVRFEMTGTASISDYALFTSSGSPIEIQQTTDPTTQETIYYGFVTIPSGSLSTTVELRPNNNAIIEGTETAVMTLTPRTTQTNLRAYTITGTSAEISIADNDDWCVSVTATDAIAEEGTEANPNYGVYTFTRSNETDTTHPLSVHFQMTGTATSSDYTLVKSNGSAISLTSTLDPITQTTVYTGIAQIPAGSLSTTVELRPVDDHLAERDETATLTIVPNGTYYTIDQDNNSATVTIEESTVVTLTTIDDIVLEPCDWISVADRRGAFRLTVETTETDWRQIYVQLSLSGTAQPGNGSTSGDYYLTKNANGSSPISGSSGQATVMIPAGQSQLDFYVIPNTDLLYEPDETVILEIIQAYSGSSLNQVDYDDSDVEAVEILQAPEFISWNEPNPLEDVNTDSYIKYIDPKSQQLALLGAVPITAAIPSGRTCRYAFYDVGDGNSLFSSNVSPLLFINPSTGAITVLREMTDVEKASAQVFTIKAYDSIYNGLYDLATLTIYALDYTLVPYTPITTYIGPMEIPEGSWKTNGVGIRRNNDYDNGTTVKDSEFTTASYSGEDDLVRVRVNIDNTIPGLSYSIQRSNSALKFWNFRSKYEEYEFSSGKYDITASQDLWAEYTTEGNDNYTISLVISETATNAVLSTETMTFRPFNSITCAFVGEWQFAGNPTSDPGINDWVIARMTEDGYDVHVWDDGFDDSDDPNYVPDCAADGSGKAFDTIVNAVNNCGVTEVAIIGYSHGGGSVYNLSSKIYSGLIPEGSQSQIYPSAEFSKPFSLTFTSYIDAIKNAVFIGIPDGSFVWEDRRPIGSQYHLNQYQTHYVTYTNNGITIKVRGTETEEVQGEITINCLPYENLNHSTIDEDEYVLDKLTDHFILNVQQ